MEKLPTAPDDVWAAYIAVSLLIYLIDGKHPAVTYRMKTLSHYNQLHEIYTPAVISSSSFKQEQILDDRI